MKFILRIVSYIDLCLVLYIFSLVIESLVKLKKDIDTELGQADIL